MIVGPSGANGRDTAPSPAEVECSRCGHIGEPVGKGQCAECRCWLPGNDAALVHGARRFVDTGLLPDDLRGYVGQFAEDVIADLGGEAELSTLQRGLVSSIAELEATRLLLLDFALRSGTDTKRGRDALALHGATVDRWARLARIIGLRREPKQVSVSLAEMLAERNGGGDA